MNSRGDTKQFLCLKRKRKLFYFGSKYQMIGERKSLNIPNGKLLSTAILFSAVFLWFIKRNISQHILFDLIYGDRRNLIQDQENMGKTPQFVWKMLLFCHATLLTKELWLQSNPEFVVCLAWFKARCWWPSVKAMKRISMGIKDYAAVSFDNFHLHWVTGIRIMAFKTSQIF